MPLKLTAADKTDVGKQREQNEDSVYKRIETSSDGDRGLFIVADGMGGYQAGEVASRIAVETISKAINDVHFFQPIQDQTTIKLALPPTPVDPDATVTITPVNPMEQNEKLQQTVKLPETPVAKRIEDQFTHAIQEANTAIVKYGERKTAARGLGCTVTAVLIQDNQAYVANVGDSRTYLLRKGKLKPITKDHSLVARLVEANQIEPEDVYSHPQRNLIYRSLGAGHKTVEVDVFHQILDPDDTLLLCSDGLWEMVRGEDLLKELTEKTSPQKICDTLIDMANANGGEDNITAVVIHVSAM
ncbi:MAG: PP2C family protein-serine/threonine phosphatase [Ktedonobacteraceae bacterium]